MADTQFGTFFELGGRGAMEALTRTGLDYVIIDTEHGCLSEETTADMILAAERGGLLPYVRIGDERYVCGVEFVDHLGATASPRVPRTRGRRSCRSPGRNRRAG